MYYGAWDVFIHTTFFSIGVVLVLGLLFVGLLIHAESKVQSEPPKRERWYKLETRKLRTPQRRGV